MNTSQPRKLSNWGSNFLLIAVWAAAAFFVAMVLEASEVNPAIDSIRVSYPSGYGFLLTLTRVLAHSANIGLYLLCCRFLWQQGFVPEPAFGYYVRLIFSDQVPTLPEELAKSIKADCTRMNLSAATIVMSRVVSLFIWWILGLEVYIRIVAAEMR